MPNNRVGKLLAGLFAGSSRAPWLLVLLVLGLQTAFMLDSRALWFSDEIRYADAFSNLVNAKHWLVLHLNGQYYPDKPPLYFWFLWLARLAMGQEGPMLFFLGAAVSGLLLVLATLALGRVVSPRPAGNETTPTAGPEPRAVTLAAGLILLSTFYLVGVCHYSRMDLLFATLITLSHLCFFKAWQKPLAPVWAGLGGLLAALATLTKGPLGLAFPLLASLAYLLWIGRWRRLLRWDVALAAGLCLTPLLA